MCNFEMTSGLTTHANDAYVAEAEAEKNPRRTKHQSIEAKLFAVNTALSNIAEDPEIGTRLASYGCDAAHLAKGQAYYDAALEAHQQVPLIQGQRRQAITTFYAQWRKAKRIYGDHLKAARRVFQHNPEAQSCLRLLERRKARFSAWLDQADQFYKMLQQSTVYSSMLAQIGLGAEQLALGRQLVETTRHARQAYERAASAEQLARTRRNKAVDAMMAWFDTFRVIARGALRDRPDLLRMLLFPKPPNGRADVEENPAPDGETTTGMEPPILLAGND